MDKANVELLLLGTQKNRNRHFLRCYANIFNEIHIVISEEMCPDISINLDIPTAIKLSKVLREQINLAKEVNNG